MCISSCYLLYQWLYREWDGNLLPLGWTCAYQAAVNCRRALLKRLRDGDWRAQDGLFKPGRFVVIWCDLFVPHDAYVIEQLGYFFFKQLQARSGIWTWLLDNADDASFQSFLLSSWHYMGLRCFSRYFTSTFWKNFQKTCPRILDDESALWELVLMFCTTPKFQASSDLIHVINVAWPCLERMPQKCQYQSCLVQRSGFPRFEPLFAMMICGLFKISTV